MWHGRDICLVVLASWALQATGAEDAAPPPPFRSLRSNAPAAMPAPTEPKTFTGYPGAPPFSVVPRKDKLTFYPCSACHGVMTPNPTPA